MELLNRYEIPEKPGVYLMKKREKIIYVGKAKNLKRRVSSYFQKNHQDIKTIELVKNIDDFQYIICKNEIEALILENNLIKKNQPKYNILLKDQKTYPYIKISKEKYPRIEIVNQLKDLKREKGWIFGPYPTGSKYLVKSIVKIFKLRDCKRDMGKIWEKPCLRYYMKTCLGPCKYKEVEKEYIKDVESSISLLKGKDISIVDELKKHMDKATEKMAFEESIKYRDQIKNIKVTLTIQMIETIKKIDEDVFVWAQEGRKIFITILKVRDGKVLGIDNLNVDYDYKLEDEKDLFLNLFIQYYDSANLPKNIILDQKFKEIEKSISTWLEREKKEKVKLFFPAIGSRRKELLEMGTVDLEKEITKYYNKKAVLEEGMKILYDSLDLKRYPRRIECFDISNISGKDAVGSMSVAIDGRLAKKEYRKYKIKTKDTPDDFSMMREVMTRRYSKLKDSEFPDLILIDGGLGQLSSVVGILKGLEKDGLTDIISIAKREEEIFKGEEKAPYIFDKSMEALKILQRLRDEAHRFGVTYHRKLRKKRVIGSELSKIPGIGPKRERELLRKFKSVKRLKEASLEELKDLVPEKIAIEIKRMK